MHKTDFIIPNWPAPSSIRALSTTRQGGYSQGGFSHLNLGLSTGDNPNTIASNRAQLAQAAALPSKPFWLKQVHGCTAICADSAAPGTTADASFSAQTNVVCCVLTADCLPVLLCNQQGTQVAAIHAGWRGLAAGIIEQTLEQLTSPAEHWMAWLGPAIGPDTFEVGDDVKHAFLSMSPDCQAAFRPASRPNKYFADIYALARIALKACGVEAIYGGEYCTYQDTERFYSYRRDKQTGRMASLIWIQK